MKKTDKNTGRKRTGKKSNEGKSYGRRILIGGTGVLFTLLMLYLFPAIYYRTHLYRNTVINGISTSNMTVSQAQDAINAEVKTYKLTLEERNGIKDSISGLHINLHTEFDNSISDLLQKQNVLLWPVIMFQPHEVTVKTMLTYDESLLKLYFQELNCFDEKNMVEPENATISAYGEDGYQIVPENPGAKVIEDKLYSEICKAINALEPTLSIEKTGCYEEPAITSDDTKLLKALDEMNRIAGCEITYEFGDDVEVLDGSKISEWLSVDENFNVNFDTNGVKEYVDYIGKTYNSFGRVRTFKTSYGKEIKVSGGDYGWWLNRPEEVKELTDLIEKGEQVKKEPVYFQTAQQYGEDDIGDTYVEVNLTAQHLFFYKDGKLVLESDFVSGNVSKNLGTPVGTYPVQYKENDATLVGEDYSTPVKYWMPFNKNIGFHDASWRDEFGKDIYLTNGSHGCINMPPASAKKMFQYIERGVAVVVYELPGTESYDVEEEETKDGTSTKDTSATEKTTKKKASDSTATEEKTTNTTSTKTSDDEENKTSAQ